MSIGSTLKETFSLKNIFKVAVISIPAFLLLGLVDLAIWHYMPGGVELFHAVKDPLLNNPIAYAMSDVFNTMATALGGGVAETALDLGVPLDPTTGAMDMDLF